MYFAFTAGQIQLRDGLHDLLVDACPPTVVRSAWSESSSPVRELWKQLGAMGLLGLLAPAEVGGMNASEVELVLLLEECGKFAVPGPLGEHIAAAVPALATGAAPEANAAVTGGLVVAVQEPNSDRVRWITTADLLVHPGRHALKATARSDLNISLERPSVDHSITSGIATPMRARSLLGSDAVLAQRRATLAVAAQLLGLADTMITMTAEYVKVRCQFGVPVGTQQSVKHLLAATLVSLEHARPVVYRAGWVMAAKAADPDLAISFAKIYATRAAVQAARTALQCHGAIGYTWEHDLHLWMKRVWALSTAWGTSAAHQNVVAAEILGALA
ncbi:acyl-CoA dehydrogenase family protein [Mycolicibacterium holsaticum]|uniref:acyl-CoA dehydrogenase family protein n=1 Tax=Mycolicibacterium holsaticum TaxID=152142 RepID=UPI001C7CA2B2|nr:acyl-CoA dehydrogenase family protein [Mycolicibacterium holsaticum]QZA12377.1 acyl-CoA dehydrogenase family protein [Mycolicibacterium holsaticum DSM 44478 = JCM 12374]UNC10139.1 acyl-CoA dehydrogenase family protein [Mycolicibacterium holsaticum DSM 44478 = JCM 12374]